MARNDDLRKSILKKTQNVLSETSFGNISNISAYESAAEDTDNSIYYSFINDTPSKLIAESLLDASCDNDLSTASPSNDIDWSDDIDKENTIIARETGIRIIVEGPTPMKADRGRMAPEIEMATKETDKVVQCSPDPVPLLEAEHEAPLTEEDTDSTCDQIYEQVTIKVVEEQIVSTESGVAANKTEGVSVVAQALEQANSPTPVILSIEDAMVVNRETNSPMPEVEIFVEDPNANLVNPFISPEQVAAAPASENNSSVVEKRSTRRSSILIAATKARFYSPVLRKSLDRKTKAVNKLATNSRRTLYEPPTRAVPPKPATKTPTKIPKPAMKQQVKPKALKCPASGCTNEFSTIKALVEHQKTHKLPTASQSFPCKWCDKKFQLETALFNHQTEKCPKIPVNEKRKNLAQCDRKEKDRRRTSIFVTPMMRKKSPRKQKHPDSMNKSGALNKSGVAITPKKSLKCHVCKAVIPDALSLANHIMSHKFDKQKQEEEKQAA